MNNMEAHKQVCLLDITTMITLISDISNEILPENCTAKRNALRQIEEEKKKASAERINANITKI